MAVPVLGKCAVILLVAILALYTGYAFKIRDGGPERGTCGVSFGGKCTAEKSGVTHLRKLESVRGRFAKIQRPPVAKSEEAEGHVAQSVEAEVGTLGEISNCLETSLFHSLCLFEDVGDYMKTF